MICLGKGWKVKITLTNKFVSPPLMCIQIGLHGNLVKNSGSGSVGLEWLPDGAAASASPRTIL